VQFCFGDCSTRGVRFGATARASDLQGQVTIDHFLLMQLAGRKDGYNFDTAAILD
jgi:hypothetical protein